MKKRRVKALSWAVVLVLASGLGTGSALAADPQYESVTTLQAKKPWFQWLAGTGFVLGVLIPTFKNPKRSPL